MNELHPEAQEPKSGIPWALAGGQLVAAGNCTLGPIRLAQVSGRLKGEIRQLEIVRLDYA
jgi:hypothetical protein